MGANTVFRVYHTDDANKVREQFLLDAADSRIEDGCMYSGEIGMFNGLGLSITLHSIR